MLGEEFPIRLKARLVVSSATSVLKFNKDVIESVCYGW